jgi:hypothetical protein
MYLFFVENFQLDDGEMSRSMRDALQVLIRLFTSPAVVDEAQLLMPIVEAFQLANSHSLIALALLVPKKLEKN